MSYPQNELARFRSYSYYHVLAICDSSSTATALADAQELSSWQHPTSKDAANDGIVLSGIYSPKSLSNGGKYCILINGSTDASLTITKASWTAFTAASATMNDRNTSIATEGTMSISEPRGITFLDTVVRCCLSLGVDSSNAFWVLKTFFVGYTYDPDSSTDGVEHITNIPPVVFITYDVTGSFGIAGGEYELSFVAAANGAARLPQYSKSADTTCLKARGTLSATVAAFADAVNKNYERYYDCVKKQVTAMEPDLGNSLRKVEYSITCGDPYNGDEYTVTDQVPQVKDNIHCDSASVITTPAGVSIEDGLHQIVAMCKKIKDEANEGIGGIKYIHKISNWITSGPSPDNNEQTVYKVGYRIDRQMQPRSVAFEQFSQGGVDKDNPNLITFDYTYTGKNIDIVEMDIKMNMGMAYLQGMTLSNPYKYPGKDTILSGQFPDSNGLHRFNGKNIPVFLGSRIKTASIRNTGDAATSSQAAYSMAKHASLEMLETTVKIIGNSQLLGSLNSTTDPEHVSKGPQEGKTASNPNAALTNWALTPSFAKINIKMPRNNDDIALFTGTQTSADNLHHNAVSDDYAVDFWFTGYYYVYQIEHVFDMGDFHQILNAIGIPEKNSFRTEQSSKQQQDVTLNARIDSCYEISPGCAPAPYASNQSPVVIPETSQAAKEAAARQIATENIPSLRNLSNIKGYDALPQNIKDEFHKASVKYGIEEFALVQMAAVESGFKATAQNSKSTAGGMFQFIDDTWLQYGGGNKYDAATNIDHGAAFTADNYVALSKTLGRPPTVSELYLAHNQGIGGATSILKNIQAGNGGVRAKVSDKAISLNRIPGNTNQAIADWAQGFVGRAIKSGVPVDNASVQSRGLTAMLAEAKNRSGTRPAKEAMAAVISCGDTEKMKQPTKNTTCPNVPQATTSDSTTSSVQSTPTGQASTPETVLTSAATNAGSLNLGLSNTSTSFSNFVNNLPR